MPASDHDDMRAMLGKNWKDKKIKHYIHASIDSWRHVRNDKNKNKNKKEHYSHVGIVIQHMLNSIKQFIH